MFWLSLCEEHQGSKIMFDVPQPPNIIPTGDNLGWLYCSFTPKACDFDNLE